MSTDIINPKWTKLSISSWINLIVELPGEEPITTNYLHQKESVICISNDIIEILIMH